MPSDLASEWATDEPIPPDVLDTFLKIKSLVDQAVAELQARAATAPDRHIVRTIEDTSIITDSITVQVHDAHQAQVVDSPTLSVQEVRQARLWLQRAAQAGVIGGVVLANLEGVLALGERVLGLLP